MSDDDWMLVHEQAPMCPHCAFTMTKLSDEALSYIDVKKPERVPANVVGFDVYQCCAGLLLMPVTKMQKRRVASRFNRRDVL